jgi:hypothetical protein
MIGFYPTMDVDYLGDDSNGSELEGNYDSVLEKFKDLSDAHLDDEIEKYKGYATRRKTGLKLPNEGVNLQHICKTWRKKRPGESSGL